MRTKQLILLVVMVLGVVPPVLQAGQLFTYVAEDAVFLRYAEEEGDLPDGYVIYRRSVGDADWNRLTREPVAPIFDADQLRAVAGLPADVLISMLGGDDKTRRLSKDDYNRVLNNQDSRNFLMMLTLGYPGLGRALGQEYVDTDLQNGASFEYRVTALRGSRETEVAVSSPQTHGQVTQLPTPDNLTVVEEGHKEVFLDWDRNKRQELQFGIVGYNIYRAQGDVTQVFVRVNSTPVMDIAVASGEDQTRAFHEDGLTNGTQYWFRLTAVNVFGFEGEPGDPVSAIPRDGDAPAEVEDLGIRVTPGAAILQWAAVDAPDLRGYRVFRSLGGIDAFEQIAPTQGPAHTGTVFVDSLRLGEVVWYRVQAVDRTGNVGPFSDAVSLYERDIVPPEQVTGLNADVTKAGDVALAWDPVDGRDVLGYRVQRSTHPSQDDDTWMTLVDEHKDTALTDTLWQTQEGEVTYRVRAHDRSDNRGRWSAWVTVRPPDELPPRPPFLVSVIVEDDKLRLLWRRNQEEDLAGYYVWHSLTEGSGYEKLTPRPLPDSIATWIDPSAALSVVNWYRMSAVDSDGNESEAGNPMGTTFYDDVPPAVPGRLQAVSDSSGIVLTWGGSEAADLKGYRVYRQAEGEAEAAFYKNLPEGATRLLDTKATFGETYAYQIAAFDTSFNFSARTPLVLVIHDPGEDGK